MRELRILVIEDSERDAALIETELEGAGYDLLYQRVETADAFRAALMDGSWDLVLSDHGMPNFSALGALRVLQELDVDLPFIIVSGTIGEDAAVACMRTGAHDYVMKGHLARLVPAVERELREAEERRRKREAEEALRQSNENFRLLFAKNPHPMWVYDLETFAFLEVNDAAIAHYGYTRDEFQGMRITDIRPADEVPRLLTDIRKIRADFNGSGGWRHRIKDGRMIDVQISSHVLEFMGRNAVLVLAQDITERKRLERAQARLAAMVQSSADAMISTTPEGTITSWNRGAEQLYGYTAAEMIGRSVQLLAPADPPTDDPETFARVREGEAIESFDTVQVRKDGHQIDVSLTISPIRDETDTVIGAASVVRDITERKAYEARLLHQALHDALTDLPNRALYLDRLDQAIAIGRHGRTQAAVLLLDLDRFKEINDTLGHQTGDELLRQVGQRLRKVLHESQTIARLGGDEFGVLLSNTDEVQATRVAAELLMGLARPFILGEQPIVFDASIGIALYPQHGDDADLLMQRADVAMYVAKQSGNAIVCYEPESDPHSVERLSLIADFRRAIEHEQLTLHYQPKVNVKTGQAEKVEALARWCHPTRGFVSPEVFIPLAESNGLIRPLTQWVLEEALRQVHLWHQAGLDECVAVNLSPWDLRDRRLVDRVTGMLEKWNVPPSRLQVEITEGILMAEPELSMATLRQLHDMGIGVAIDDFGTGYSSLTYLHRLPVDEVKIDRGFVTGMTTPSRESATIVRSVIDLGHHLGLVVVAEGVETKECLDMLAAMGCDLAQGYGLARPMPAPEYLTWRRNQLG